MARWTPSALRYYAQSGVDVLRGMTPPATILRLLAPGFPAPSEPVRIHLRRTGETFLVRSGMDVWSVKEAFIDRLYQRYGFAIEPGWHVVDIGAAIGEFTVLAARVPGTTVIACEPFPGSVDLLRENIALNLLSNVTVLPVAVAGERGTMILDLRGNEPLKFVSTMHEVPSRADAVPAGHLAVAAIPLAEVLARTPGRHIDLLKLDCEGAEYDILMQAAPATLAAVDRIVMEYHDTTTPHTHPELERFLTDAGFEVASVPNVVHPDAIGYLWAARPAVGGLPG
ncbi:MAG: FkbM family methyltransferase [Thermomicrobiales bacterium]